jgi:hypothetical protein
MGRNGRIPRFPQPYGKSTIFNLLAVAHNLGVTRLWVEAPADPALKGLVAVIPCGTSEDVP